jgi:hypothetical protein
VVRPYDEAGWARIARHRALQDRAIRLLAMMSTGFAPPRRDIWFFPDLPSRRHVVGKLCAILGIAPVPEPTPATLCGFFWYRGAVAPATFRPPPEGLRVLNLKNTDVRKSTVNAAFEAAFGYPLALDPLSFRGLCVEKSDANATHDGRIVSCPVKRTRSAKVYQRLVDSVTGEWIEEYRIPVFGGRAPFVYRKLTPLDQRFTEAANTRSSAELQEVNDCLSREEVRAIADFCNRLHLDYGELDVLRDRQDGRLYVVDANNTPAGPVDYLPIAQTLVAARMLATGFEELLAGEVVTPAR